MATSQPSPSALQAFFDFEEGCQISTANSLTSSGGTKFIPLAPIVTYLSANDCQNLHAILIALFPRYVPLDPSQIIPTHTAIFCILLHLNHGVLIEEFAQYEELSDQRLPFDFERLPKVFLDISAEKEFQEAFCGWQMRYCVPVFEYMVHRVFGTERVLPIVWREKVGQVAGREEGEGEVVESLVKIYAPFNRLVKDAEESTNPYANTFLLKTYTKQHESIYREEVAGFRSVKGTDSIIRFYGSYIQGGEYNILLEYADKGTLEDFFRRETPPSRGVEIIAFWEGLFQLIKALRTIHDVRAGHFNVRPERILVVSGGNESQLEWKFKLASFGGVDNSRKSGHDTADSRDYDAPEYYNEAGNAHVTCTADIWSLGCICSEAAMWIADGYKGLLAYRSHRAIEISKFSSEGGSAFHDGQRVLQSILEAHTDIEDRLRRSDYITKDVLDSMVNEMLWEEDRPSAKALLRKSEMLLLRARQKIPGDEVSRPGSSQRRDFSPTLQRLKPPPTQPLPPVPQIPRELVPGLSTIAERPQPLNVENWRAQVPSPQNNRSVNGLSSPISMNRNVASVGSVSDCGGDRTRSVASWQHNEHSPEASPNTPLTSPHTSVHYEPNAHNPNEGRPRTFRNPSSFEQRTPIATTNGLSFQEMLNSEYTSSPAHPASPAPTSPQRISQFLALSPTSKDISFTLRDPRTLSPSDIHPLFRNASLKETHSQPHTPRSSYSSSTPPNHPDESSSIHSQPLQQIEPPPKSTKRPGFSLFPSKSHSQHVPADKHTQPQSHSSPQTPLSPPSNPPLSRSNTLNTHTSAFQTSPPIPEYLSLNTCLEWKRYHKSHKPSLFPSSKSLSAKNTLPTPPSLSHLLLTLPSRNHIFIIDDSSSMSPHWPDVLRVFSALSYIVKGMSEGGTELYFMGSYDAFQRRDTRELVGVLERKELKGVVDGGYRLGLLVDGWIRKIWEEGKKGGKGRKGSSVYILTNGEWGKGNTVRDVITKAADFLTRFPDSGEPGICIQFISFATTATQMKNVNSCIGGYKIDMVDCERATGNVVRMLRGVLDKGFQREGEMGDGDGERWGKEGSVELMA